MSTCPHLYLFISIDTVVLETTVSLSDQWYISLILPRQVEKNSRTLVRLLCRYFFFFVSYCLLICITSTVNFSRKYFRKLGELAEMPISREERSKRRRIDGGAMGVASTVIGQDGTTVQRQIAMGDIVNVASRTWPGINKPGGVGLVTNITPVDNSVKYDVTYVMGGRENDIDAQFVQLN